MFALAAFAQANALEQTFSRPPQRSIGPARRQRESLIGSLIGRARRLVVRAESRPATA
ncbi:MAG: hypothetical protein IT341_02055 [Chloroflexi bacterium]|nr:hypothetical protein [Chloroflexota bacterium]